MWTQSGQSFPIDVQVLALEVTKTKFSDPVGVIKPHGVAGIDGMLSKRKSKGDWCISYDAAVSFQLVGGDSGWRQARPGLIFEVLAKGDSAAPVLILDEVDKIGSGTNYPIVPVLLDLLEPDTARAFYDAFFRMEFDASRMIIVLTANDLDRVPPPLLSRVEVFDIPTPDPEQRMQIILAKVDHLQRSTGKHIQLEEGGATSLAKRTDLDLRQLHRTVVDAFAIALATGKCVATLAPPPPAKRQPIGFTRHG